MASVALGVRSTAEGKGALAIGPVSSASKEGSTAIGINSTASGINSIAMGRGATASQDGSVALGSGSLANNATLNTVAYSPTGSISDITGKTDLTTLKQISVGTITEERRITNVAPGGNDTDAVNVSQLKRLKAITDKTGSDIASNLGGGSTFNPATGAVTNPTYNVVTGNTTPAQAGNSNQNFTTTPAKNVGDALTNLNTYINQGFKVVDNAGATKGVVTPGESVKFANGTATTAIVDTEAGGVTTVKYNVEVDGTTTTINGNNQIAAVTTTFTPSTDGKVGAPVGNGDSLVTANTVANAINNSGWKATSGATGSGVVNGTTEELINPSETVTFQAGDNMVLNQAGNVFTYSLNKDININSVQIGANGPKITNDGNNIKIGDKDGNATKITNVAAGTDDTDAVNVSQLEKAQAAATTKVEGDKGVSVTPKPNADGSTTYTVAAKTDGITTKIDDKGNIAAVTAPLTTNTDGKVNTPAAPNAIATAGDVANAINNSGFTLTAQGSNGSLVKPGATVDMNNTDGNIVISKSASDNKVTYNLAKDLKVDSVTAGDTVVNNDGITINNGSANGNTVSLTKDGLNNGGNRITNVAPGVNGTDAVNVDQLKGIGQHINNRIDDVADDANAGVSSAMAMAALPQAYIPGKSMLTGGIASYNGEGAVAVGFSKLSDNGRWVLKVSGSADTQGNAGGAVGAGFHF